MHLYFRTYMPCHIKSSRSIRNSFSLFMTCSGSVVPPGTRACAACETQQGRGVNPTWLHADHTCSSGALCISCVARPQQMIKPVRVMSWTRVLSDTTEHHVKTVGRMHFLGQHGLPRVFAEAAQDRQPTDTESCLFCRIWLSTDSLQRRPSRPVGSQHSLLCRSRAHGCRSQVRWQLKRFKKARQSLDCLPVFVSNPL